ncbi:MAG: spermidine/putrescine ABC transporter substrate-binding protein [Clostridia bacterium]|nr:spermidine/putrescine ABC transporter substrate-binding protein [Clostridia bacterium]
MKRISALIFVLLIAISAFSSCKGDEKTVTLNVYNWGEYISDGSDGSFNTNKEFENYFNRFLSEKYGGIKVKVNYTTYPTNEDMYSKLVSGSGSYDVVFPSDYMIEKLISEDILIPLPWSNLKSESNFHTIDTDYISQPYDPDNLYTVAYTFGRTGIIYNTTMVDEEDIDGSWGLLWNPKYSGRILQFNNPRDAFGTAMYWKDIDINSDDEEDWNEALRILKDQKQYLQGYVNDEIFDKMTGESAAIAPYFVGDFVTMYSENDNLAFYYPEEGTNVFVDAMCIPTSSKNPEIALEYINFMLSPDAAIANALFLGYASPSRYVYNDDPLLDEIYGEYNSEYMESLAFDYFLDAEDEENPTEEELKVAEEKADSIFNLLYNYEDPGNYSHEILFYRNFTPEIQRHVNSLWEELKIHGTEELWVHITSAVLVGTILIFAIYSAVVKKKRSKDYRMRDKALKVTKSGNSN